MWGQAFPSTLCALKLRIIPTRVGTSSKYFASSAPAVDHPHACGDKPSTNSVLGVKDGSSPRVWGQAQRFINKIHERRIIPTRVGTSFSVNQRRVKFQDHPHACGDKSENIIFIHPTAGSSPRVWGQEQPRAETSQNSLIIPTRVGTRENVPIR